MCCNSHSKSATANDENSVHVDQNGVATPLPDGYWLNAFPFSQDQDEFPDLIGYGLGFEGKPSAIKLFQNPKNTNSKGWKLTEIQSMDFPVAMTYADLTGNGFNDVIICDRYGPNMGNLWDAKTQNGGRIQWLQNPGDRTSQPFWKAQHIGNSTGMHRLAAGHFTIKDHFQVMGLPIIPASGDLTSPAPIIIYTPKYGADQRQGPHAWTESIAFNKQFRLIHEVKVLPGANHGLDMALVAGREGIVLLWFDVHRKAWKFNIVGTGIPQEKGNPYWGSGSVDVVRVQHDDVGYIATCEAFHGNTVSVYIKDHGAPSGVESLKDSSLWTRVVIDDFGPLDPEQHTGTIHNLVAVKVGRSHVHSFAVACMGAPVGKPENQGVFLYTPTDLKRGHFKKTRITTDSAGRLAIAAFENKHRMDIASISYYVPGYHTGLDPPSIRTNVINAGNPGTVITATKLNKEVLIRVPRPSIVPHGHVPALPLVTLAGRRLSLVVLQPGGVVRLPRSDGIKVIYGDVGMVLESGQNYVRGIAPPVKDIGTTHIVSHDGCVNAGPRGAVFLRVEELEDESQGPFATMGELVVKNKFPGSPHVSDAVRALEFPFLKVDTLDWGQSSGLWNEFEFYNMTGFYVYFNDDAMEEVVHMQAWTLGIGETARFHNHSDRSFCEIHYCLTNGGGQGGMRYFEDSYTDPIDTAAELTKDYVEKNSTLLVVPDMHEHGPLWKIQPGSRARPQLRPDDTVDYPWHAWLASGFGDFELPIRPALSAEKQSYDVWMAFEFPSSAFQF